MEYLRRRRGHCADDYPFFSHGICHHFFKLALHLPDFELAARVSGASVMAVLRTVTLPLLRPALLSAFTLTAIANLADFGIPAIIGSPARFETLATMIYRFIDSGTVSNPLQVVSTIGVVLLFLGIGAVIMDYLTSLKNSSST